jgi:hypothetical protein
LQGSISPYLRKVKPVVSEAVFERLNESIRRNQELLDRLP